MYTVGITGASGSIYAARLLGELLARGASVNVVITTAGREVLRHELGWDIPAAADEARDYLHLTLGCAGLPGSLHYYGLNDWQAPVASGSAKNHATIILPCSMGTLGRIAHGISGNLLERAADVALKERRQLIVVPRETPLSAIHLENMLTLSRAGALILPAMPAFYTRPETLSEAVNFVVGRVLDQLGLAHDLYQPWTKGGEM